MTGRDTEIAALRAEMARLTEERDRAAHDAAAALTTAERLRSALDKIPVGVVVADANGRIVHGNQEVERIVGHPVLLSASAEDYGEWRGYHHDGTRISTAEYPLYKVLRDGAPDAELDVHYERPDGQRIWLQLSARPITDTSGVHGGAVVAVTVIDAVKKSEAEKALLLAELDHRVKNIFATMSALISRSLRGSDELEDAAERLQSRIHAYAESHSALTSANWAGSTIGDVARVTLGGHIAAGRVRVDGPEIPMSAKAALSLSMAFHELATNATKYGALATEDGNVALNWEPNGQTEGGCRIVWQERGGPKVQAPSRQGFGSFIIEKAVAMETNGVVSVEMDEDGLRWVLET